MQYLIDDAGEILQRFIQCCADGLSSHGRKAKSQDKGKYNCGQSIEHRRNADGKERGNGLIRCSLNLCHGIGRHKAREKIDRNKVRNRSANQSGPVCQNHRHKQQLPGSLRKVRNTHADIRQNHQGNNKLQEITKNSGQRHNQLAESERSILSNQNTENDGNDQFRHQAKFHLHFFLLLHGCYGSCPYSTGKETVKKNFLLLEQVCNVEKVPALQTQASKYILYFYSFFC